MDEVVSKASDTVIRGFDNQPSAMQITRSVPSGKVYNRKKKKQRIGVESRSGFDADFFVQE